MSLWHTDPFINKALYRLLREGKGDAYKMRKREEARNFCQK